MLLAEIGAGERMMDKALVDIYTLERRFAKERSAGGPAPTRINASRSKAREAGGGA
jgi:hypothetical protein